jgi:hypothetical protein
MARLPNPGGDDGTWGDILNSFLEVALNSDGTLQDATLINSLYQKPIGGIPIGDLSSIVQAALASNRYLPIAGGAMTNDLIYPGNGYLILDTNGETWRVTILSDGTIVTQLIYGSNGDNTILQGYETNRLVTQGY